MTQRKIFNFLEEDLDNLALIKHCIGCRTDSDAIRICLLRAARRAKKWNGVNEEHLIIDLKNGKILARGFGSKSKARKYLFGLLPVPRRVK